MEGTSSGTCPSGCLMLPNMGMHDAHCSNSAVQNLDGQHGAAITIEVQMRTETSRRAAGALTTCAEPQRTAVFRSMMLARRAMLACRPAGTAARVMSATAAATPLMRRVKRTRSARVQLHGPHPAVHFTFPPGRGQEIQTCYPSFIAGPASTHWAGERNRGNRSACADAYCRLLGKGGVGARRVFCPLGRRSV